MSDDARERALFITAARVTALREMVALLLALHARSAGNPDALFREVAGATDARLAAIDATDPHLVPHVERIREELDWLVTAARAMLGQV